MWNKQGGKSYGCKTTNHNHHEKSNIPKSALQPSRKKTGNHHPNHKQ